MRYLVLFILLLFIVPAFCGCIQQYPAPAQPSPVPTAVPSPVPSPARSLTKDINLTTWEGEHAVTLQYNGGRDAQSLVMLNVQINNRDGRIVKTPIYRPEIGKQYQFPYIGIVNPNTMNVVGVFSDGTEQTVLLYYY